MLEGREKAAKRGTKEAEGRAEERAKKPEGGRKATEGKCPRTYCRAQTSSGKW